MRRPFCWSTVSLAALLAAGSILPPPVAAATVLERMIDVEIRPDGSVL